MTSEDVHNLKKNQQHLKPWDRRPSLKSPNTCVLKINAEEFTHYITANFQKPLDRGIIPEDWLNANIAPVFKNGDVHAASIYRTV